MKRMRQTEFFKRASADFKWQKENKSVIACMIFCN